MPELKFVVSNKGKTYQKTIENQFSGLKIGDKVDGNEIGFKGYEFEITGGSDTSGFPMRKGIDSPARKKGFFGKGIGVNDGIDRKGKKIRKTVVGSIVSDNIAQLNLKVVKAGTEDLAVLMPKEAKKE